jgi:uncharacterized membrane protein
MSETSKQSEPHIDAIVRQEEEALERRSSSERLADAVGVFPGSLLFIAVHLVFLLAWLLVNDGEIPSQDRSTLTRSRRLGAMLWICEIQLEVVRRLPD